MDRQEERDLSVAESEKAEIEFIRLSDMPDMVEACALFHEQCTSPADGTAEESAARLDMRRAAFRKLALDGEDEDAILCLSARGNKAGRLVGLCALVQKELQAYEDLGPWLTGLVIKEDINRHLKLESRLIEETEELARSLGYLDIFIHTVDPDNFRIRDYAEIESYEKEGAEHWVMAKALEA
jgi:GNAT superfamily N-acetyltransferase